MSYVSQGLLGLAVGAVAILGLVGLVLIPLAIIILVYGLSDVQPGTLPARCSKWGHDWRAQLPLMPAGKTCRNCLVRKDGSFIAWHHSPKGVPHVFDPAVGCFIPQNAPAHAAKKPPKGLYLADDARLPFVALEWGKPIEWPALRAIRLTPAEVEIREGATDRRAP